MKIRYILILLALTISTLSEAQDKKQATLLNTGEQSLSLQYGIDYSFGTVEIGYHRGMKIRNKSVILGTEIAFPIFNLDFGDYRIRILKLQGSIYKHHNFDASIMYSPTLTKNTNKVTSLFAWGHEAQLRFGFWGEKWGVGSNISINKQITTRITHTEYFKQISYNEVEDGWYKGTGGNIRISLEGARKLGKVDLNLKVGITKTLKFENYLLIPEIYGVLKGIYRF